MKKSFAIIFIFFFSIFYTFNAFASKKDIMQELLVISKNDLNNFIKKKKNRVLGNIKVVTKKPKPRILRSATKYEFNYDQLNTYNDYDINRDFIQFLLPNENKREFIHKKKFENKNNNEEDENIVELVESYDLNQDGIIDTIINFKDPVTAYIDANQNGIFEIEYLFNKNQRWVYIDEDEDNNLDYLFKDINNDGIDDEIIKLNLN